MTAMLISAALLRAADAPYTVEQAKLSDPGPGEVLVKIAGAGLCHTDLPGRTDLAGKPVILGPKAPALITTYPLSQINQAEAAASGTADKPVLIPDQ
jgi:hypothetical protein